MPFALRVLVMLAAVTPLFAATAFHPSWWQVLLAAVLGSAVGQVALRLTRGHRIAAWSVAAVAALGAAAAGVWSFTHESRHTDRSTDASFLVVKSTSTSSLTWDDLRAIQTQIPSVHLAAPYLRTLVTLGASDSNWNTVLVGTTDDYFRLWSMQAAAGKLFDSSAASSGEKVVVVGDTVVTQLYGANQNPVGDIIRINNIPFTIIGVLAHQGMAPTGQDLDDVAIVPVRIFASKIATRVGFGGAVLIMPTSRDDTARLEAELRSLLRDRHRLSPGTDDDFVIRAPIEN